MTDRIEALRTELLETKKDVTDMETRAFKAEAENARLRYALRAIANLETWPDYLMSDKDIARAALEENNDE